MNRLWIRISFIITIVLIFGMLLPMMIGIAMREFNLNENPPPPELSEDLGPAEFRARIEERAPRFFPGWFVLRNLIPQLIGITIISILVGVLLSRNLSAPLSKLADAARAIGARHLTQRVEIHGSQEIQEVSLAFNEMAADLEQAEVLRQNLLTDVAHELRTPLTVIQGNLQAILDEVYQLDQAEIARLYDQTRQLSRLVDDLRELAQAEARQLPLERTDVDLAALANDVTGMYAPIAEAAGIELRTQISEGLPAIWGDRARLTQCLQNLLNNAIRHTAVTPSGPNPEGGVVTLTLNRDAENLELRVADTGSGIDPAQLPHVFDRFYRADPARARETGGTGLGLAITRAIVEVHGGEIFAESEGEGKGSTFVIRFTVGSWS
jgi:signal transduction histidine kinase